MGRCRPCLGFAAGALLVQFIHTVPFSAPKPIRSMPNVAHAPEHNPYRIRRLMGATASKTASKDDCSDVMFPSDPAMNANVRALARVHLLQHSQRTSVRILCLVYSAQKRIYSERQHPSSARRNGTATGSLHPTDT